MATTSDSGKTWTEVIDDKNLPEPTCQASFIRYTDVRDGFSRNRLLFVNPANTSQRVNLTIRLSYDEGKNWSISKVLYEGRASYSSLARLPDGRVGVLYERDGDQRMTFSSFTLGWRTDLRE